MIIFTFVS